MGLGLRGARLTGTVVDARHGSKMGVKQQSYLVVISTAVFMRLVYEVTRTVDKDVVPEVLGVQMVVWGLGFQDLRRTMAVMYLVQVWQSFNAKCLAPHLSDVAAPNPCPQNLRPKSRYSQP